MVYTENGTYTAVRRRASHHCTRSPPEAMPLPNWGVLSAAPCISNIRVTFDLSCFSCVSAIVSVPLHRRSSSVIPTQRVCHNKLCVYLYYLEGGDERKCVVIL